MVPHPHHAVRVQRRLVVAHDDEPPGLVHPRVPVHPHPPPHAEEGVPQAAEAGGEEGVAAELRGAEEPVGDGEEGVGEDEDVEEGGLEVEAGGAGEAAHHGQQQHDRRGPVQDLDPGPRRRRRRGRHGFHDSSAVRLPPESTFTQTITVGGCASYLLAAQSGKLWVHGFIHSVQYTPPCCLGCRL